jgi:hypothetical protein
MLKVDHSDKTKDDMLIPVIREKAYEIYTTALLLADDKRKPQIAIESDDIFEGIEQIALFVEENKEGGDGGSSDQG